MSEMLLHILSSTLHPVGSLRCKHVLVDVQNNRNISLLSHVQSFGLQVFQLATATQKKCFVISLSDNCPSLHLSAR